CRFGQRPTGQRRTIGNAFAQSVHVRYALIFLLLAGCGGGKSPEEKLLKDVEPAVSWVATLQLAGEKWLGNSVPTRFVRAAASSAQKSFDRAKRSIERSPAKKELRDQLRQQIAISAAAAAKLN